MTLLVERNIMSFRSAVSGCLSLIIGWVLYVISLYPALYAGSRVVGFWGKKGFSWPLPLILIASSLFICVFLICLIPGCLAALAAPNREMPNAYVLSVVIAVSLTAFAVWVGEARSGLDATAMSLAVSVSALVLSCIAGALLVRVFKKSRRQ
jgi:hypothetical protein